MSNFELSFEYITRGNVNPQRKQKAYISYHPDDRIYVEHTAELILNKFDCAVYFYDYEKNGIPDETELGQILGEIQLFIIPVTSNYLYHDSIAYNFEFKYAMEHHVRILPLLQNSDLSNRFNERCGNLQFLDEYAKDETAISFNEKLRKFLESVFLDEETIERVQAAFDAYVFLSYRKKDREYAQRLMKLIHKNELCRDIAIWYDEFLVPGEPFDEAIKEALGKSDLFALLVTPNLINEDNYVKNVEYPKAREAKKTILAAESVYTERKELEEKFEGIPECLDANNETQIPKEVKEVIDRIKKIAIGENNTPEHNFLIGLAYLSGIDMEKNNDYALELITGAAENGLGEAMKKLAEMYYDGVGCQRDIIKAMEWQEKYVAYCAKIYDDTASDEAAEDLILERDVLSDYLIEAALIEKAESAYAENISFVEQLAQSNPERYNCYLAVSYNNAGAFYL